MQALRRQTRRIAFSVIGVVARPFLFLFLFVSVPFIIFAFLFSPS